MEVDLIGRLRANISQVLAGQPVMLAYLYGSAATGHMGPSSDVDIGIVFNSNTGLSAYERMQMEFRIASEIERSCGIQEADVRGIDNAPLTVQGEVVTEGILLYSRDEEFRVDYEVHTRKYYFDFLPVVQMMRHSFLQQLREEGFRHGKARQG